MAILDMKTYTAKQEASAKAKTEVVKKEKDGTEIDSGKKEIQIVSIRGEGAASTLIGNTLREVLLNDNIKFIDRDDEASDIFRNVKFVSSEDVERDLGEVSRFATESRIPVVLFLRKNPSLEERVFLNNIKDQPNIFHSFEEYYEPLKLDILKEEELSGVYRTRDMDDIGTVVDLYGTLVYQDTEISLFKKGSYDYRVYKNI